MGISRLWGYECFLASARMRPHRSWDDCCLGMCWPSAHDCGKYAHEAECNEPPAPGRGFHRIPPRFRDTDLRNLLPVPFGLTFVPCRVVIHLIILIKQTIQVELFILTWRCEGTSIWSHLCTFSLSLFWHFSWMPLFILCANRLPKIATRGR